jgi:hypothetical protein
MRAFVAGVRVLAAVVAPLVGCAVSHAAPPCYHDNGGVGWKRAALPVAAPHLSAPDGIDQYRTGEPYLVWSEQGMAEPTAAFGSSRFVLRVDEQADAIAVDFAARLGGAQVDVVAHRAWADLPLLVRERQHGASLRFEVPPGTWYVEVVVHHHLRAAPLVTSWRLGVRTLGEPMSPPSLVYYNPDGRPLELCEAPEAVPSVRRARLPAPPPSSVALAPTPLTRLLYR